MTAAKAKAVAALGAGLTLALAAVVGVAVVFNADSDNPRRDAVQFTASQPTVAPLHALPIPRFSGPRKMFANVPDSASTPERPRP